MADLINNPSASFGGAQDKPLRARKCVGHEKFDIKFLIDKVKVCRINLQLL